MSGSEVADERERGIKPHYAVMIVVIALGVALSIVIGLIERPGFGWSWLAVLPALIGIVLGVISIVSATNEIEGMHRRERDRESNRPETLV